MQRSIHRDQKIINYYDRKPKRVKIDTTLFDFALSYNYLMLIKDQNNIHSTQFSLLITNVVF